MIPIPTFILGHERVVSIYGRWPAFHDANLLSLDHHASSSRIDLTLHTWTMTSEIDEKGYFVLKNHHLVHFQFDEVSDLHITDFHVPNILFSLGLKPQAQNQEEHSRFEVFLDSVMEFNGSFLAGRGSVLSVTPCARNSKPL